jgi:hypothetical protein
MKKTINILLLTLIGLILLSCNSSPTNEVPTVEETKSALNKAEIITFELPSTTKETNE